MFKRFMKLETAVFAALIASVALNAALGWRLHNQSRLLDRTRSEQRLQPNTPAPELTGLDPSGASHTIDFRVAQAGTVLYVFTPTCGWCKKNLDNMRTVADAAAKRGMKFVALSLTDVDLPKYIADNNISAPVLYVSAESRRAYRLGGTPQTIVVSQTGRIERSWMGAYAAPVAEEIETFFAVSLPGLAK